MDLTKKIKSLVVRQGSRVSQSVDHVSSEVVGDANVAVMKPETREAKIDPQIEEEILQSIEKVYYENDVDAGLYELQKLPETVSAPKLHSDLMVLKKQLLVVSKKISHLILQNQSAYTLELQRVTNLQSNLESATLTCSTSRRCLAQAKSDFTTASLGILASFRKREQLRGLLRSLHTIKTLQQTDMRLRELLEEEDYPGAIQLCLECQKAASTFSHYSCISELSSKLHETLEMMEEQLDVALSKVCVHFDIKLYDKLQAAYRLLGKTQTATDQLLMHFTTAIHNKAFTIILGYVELCAGDSQTNFQKRQYSDLCKCVTVESFTPCLTDLCKALWEVVRSYWCIVEWHEENGVCEDEASGEETSKRYVQKKLEHGVIRIWQDIQLKAKIYILAPDLSSFKFDEFIRILELMRRLCVIGEEFSGSKSDDLQESVRKQTVNYFRNYHRGCMEELRMFLENESWELCPVKANFTTLNLQEFHFLSKTARSSQEAPTSPTSPQAPENVRKFSKNPFDTQLEDEESEDVMDTNEEDKRQVTDSDSDDSDVPDELKKDYIDEKTEESGKKQNWDSKKFRSSGRRKHTLILTNTTLNILRLFGKYMHMMTVLRPIAFDVLICMSQLFDYYMYAVYVFFAKEMGNVSEHSLSNKLRTTLKRIKENLILEDEEQLLNASDGRTKDKVPAPALSPVVDLQDAQQLYGLAERLAGAESLAFLVEQFELLYPHLEALVPAPKRAFLQQFFSQTISTGVELRLPIYMSVAARAVDYEQILNLMANVKWDLHEIMSQHSSYVDILVRKLQELSMRILEISKRVPVPKEAYELLWENCIRLSNRTFIEGFSQAKKCTNEGRALMQLDYQQFLSKVERLSDIRPLPDRDLVEGYIKAYYLLEGALEQWIRLHKEYSSKQLLGLINCVSQINKKGRQRLTSLVEDSERSRR